MLAYKLKTQTISEVTDKINELKKLLGYELFHKVFPIMLTDNGKEFKRPDLIEDNGQDVVKTKVFYCDSRRSDQKGSIEVTHEYIRRFIEQGTNLDKYSDGDIMLMMNHINNTRREKLNGDTPFNLMKEKIGEENIKKLGFYFIPSQDIILKPSLFNKDKMAHLIIHILAHLLIQFPYFTTFFYLVNLIFHLSLFILFISKYKYFT